MAIKSIQHTQLKGKLRSNLLSEIEILRQAHHPHIVGLLEVLETPHNIHLVMEFCQLGDLATFVKKRDKLGVHPITANIIRNYPNPAGGGFNEVIVRHFSKQLASALSYLVDRKLIHRDLKPQNLLLVAPTSWLEHELPVNRPYQIRENPLVAKVGVDSMPCLKIADFGFARHLPQGLAETLCGSPLYMAPEILRYEKYDNKSDLWSVGIVMYELAVGRPPFKANNHVELLRKIEVNMDRIPFPSDIDISNDMKVVIRGLLKKQPTERMSWERFFESGVVVKDIPGLVASDRPKRKDAVREAGRENARDVVREAVHDAIYEEPHYPGRRVSSGQASLETKANNVGEALTSKDKKSSSSPNQAQRTTPPSPASLQRQPMSAPAQQSRPFLKSAATSPAFQVSRPGSSGVQEMQRRKSNYSGAPELYAIRDVPERSERDEYEQRNEYEQRRKDRAARDARERAAQDIAFERDYVMVEKRAVEINALADELAATPQVRGSYPPKRGSEPSPLLRRATTQASSSPTAVVGIQPGSTAPASISTQVALRSSEATQQRQQSYERRYGPGKGISATSALAAALNLVNFRIHGIPNLAAFGTSSPPQHLPFPAFPTFPVTANAFTLLNESKPKMDKDEEVLERVREGANRCDVVFGYAEVKYIQLIPIAPSAPAAHQALPTTVALRAEITGPSSTTATAASSRNVSPANTATPLADATAINALTRQGQAAGSGHAITEPEDITLPPISVVQISEEGMLLYLKVLQLLDNVMDLCGSWYRLNKDGSPSAEPSETKEAHALSDSEELRTTNLTYTLHVATALEKEEAATGDAGLINALSDAVIDENNSTAVVRHNSSASASDAATTEPDAAEVQRKAIRAHNKTLQGIKQVMKWARNRWNETLVRADYCQCRFEAARQLLPETHAAHPSNDPPERTPGTSYLSKKLSAEDLLFWRAHEICKGHCLTELPLGVPIAVLKELQLGYKSAARMWEAILECEGATWKEVKDENEKKKEALKNTPESQVVVTWKYFNNPEIVKESDVDRVIERKFFPSDTALGCVDFANKVCSPSHDPPPCAVPQEEDRDARGGGGEAEDRPQGLIAWVGSGRLTKHERVQ